MSSAAENRLLEAAKKAALSESCAVWYRNTLLHRAAGEGRTGTVELLLDRGADREAVNKYGNTLLHRAAGRGHTGTVELLLDRGANREAVNKNGNTPLHRAAWEGHSGTVELLLDRGADREAKNKEGKTPLDIAKKEEIKALLRGASAAAEREKAEADHLAAEREKAEADRLVAEREKAEADRLAAERGKAEADRLVAEREKAEADRLAAEGEKAEADRLAAQEAEADHSTISPPPASRNVFSEWARGQLAELGVTNEDDIALCFQFLTKNVKSKVLLGKFSQSEFGSMVEASDVGFALKVALKHIHSQLSPSSAAVSAGAVLTVDWATHRRSSGASSIADAEYTLGNDKLPVKVKTAQRSSPGFRLDHEHNVLKKFSCHEMTKGLFVACHDFIDGADRVSVRNGPAFPPDQAFLVLERGGRNLTECAKEIRQRQNLFKDLMLDVLAIIASAHAAQYVLMDVKGSNFVLFPGRHGDLAVLKAIDVEGAVGVGEDIGSTGAVVTPSSAPPELFRKGPVRAHPAVDIWALGIMCCELLTDQPFWLRAGLHTDAEIAARLAEVTQADVDGMLSRSEIPKVWMKFVSACLAVDPSARPSAAALLNSAVFSGASSVTASKFMQQFKAVSESMTQVGRQLDRIGLGVEDIQVGVGDIKSGVGDIKSGVGELNSKVSLLLASLPEQLSELRAGLEGLVGGSLGPLLPLREELAGIGAAVGEQAARLELLLGEGAALTPAALLHALSAVELSVGDAVRAAAAEASAGMQEALSSHQAAVVSAVRSVEESVEAAAASSQLSQEDLRRTVELMRAELSSVRATTDDILQQVKELTDVAARAARATSDLCVSLGPVHAAELGGLAAQLRQSIEAETARGASHAERLGAVTAALETRLRSLPSGGDCAELLVIVKEIRDGGASNEAYAQCAVEMLRDLSGRVGSVAEGLSAVRARVDGLPAQLSSAMGAVLAAQQEALLEKMADIADATALHLKQVEKANNALKLGLVVGSVRVELQDWLSELVSSAAESAAQQASAGVREAALTQQTALFQQLASLEAIAEKLQDSAVSRGDLGALKAELSGLITTVGDGVSAVQRKLDSLESAFGQLRGSVDGLRAEAGGHSAVLDAAVAQMQLCASTESVTELVKGLERQAEALHSDAEKRVMQTVAELVRQVQPGPGDPVSSGGAELAEILEGVRALRDEVRAADDRSAVLHSLAAKIEAKMNHFPRKMLFLPEPKISSGRSLFRRSCSRVKGLLWTKTRLHFVCSLSQQPALSGQGGQGYLLSLDTPLLRGLKPVLALSAIVLKAALSAYGVPLPLPDGVSQMMYADAVSAFVCEQLQGAAESALDRLSDAAAAVGDQPSRGSAVMDGSLQQVYEMLLSLEQPGQHVATNWQPEHTGLVCTGTLHGVQGDSQWVLPRCRDLYAAGGEPLLLLCEAAHRSGGHPAADALLQEAQQRLAVSTAALATFIAQKRI